MGAIPWTLLWFFSLPLPLPLLTPPLSLSSMHIGPQRAQRALGARRAVMAWGPGPEAPRRYEGGLLGVRADVTLHLGNRSATFVLMGAAIGGRIEGHGSLVGAGAGAGAGDGMAGAVVLDENTHRALARRFVAIRRASFSETKDSVTVLLSVPLFGAQRVVLRRV